jgi:NitT/TauT family transport system ATP-binding protein
MNQAKEAAVVALRRGTEPGESVSRNLMVDSTNKGRGGIAVRDVVHHYMIERDGELITLPAIAGASLDVAPGEFVSLIGPSGCGKTTLLNMVAGIVAVQEGSILLGNAAPRLGRSDVAYMFASDCLLPWRTAIANVEFGMELRGFDAQERTKNARVLLREAGLEGFESAYTRQLSKGMRQRVALARTFGVPCEFLLMDEPFGALDPQTKLVLQQQLLSLLEKHPGRGVLFVTHDLGEAIIMSDRVVVMSRRPGRIKANIRINLPRPRNATELLKSSEFHRLYSELWGELGAEINPSA